LVNISIILAGKARSLNNSILTNVRLGYKSLLRESMISPNIGNRNPHAPLR
jgi:hypothetical protein